MQWNVKNVSIILNILHVSHQSSSWKVTVTTLLRAELCIWKLLRAIQYLRVTWNSASLPRIPLLIWLEIAVHDNAKLSFRNSHEQWGHIFVAPLHFFVSTSTISRFGERFRDGHYSLVSFLFAVLLLTVPPCPAICKSGARAPPCLS